MPGGSAPVSDSQGSWRWTGLLWITKKLRMFLNHVLLLFKLYHHNFESRNTLQTPLAIHRSHSTIMFYFTSNNIITIWKGETFSRSLARGDEQVAHILLLLFILDHTSSCIIIIWRENPLSRPLARDRSHTFDSYFWFFFIFYVHHSERRQTP